MSKISELVPASTLAELGKLDTEMQRSVTGMKQLLAESEKVNNSLKNQAVSYRELADAILKANEVEKNMTATRRQQKNILSELERTGQKIIETSGKQVQAMERLRTSIEKMDTSVKNSTDSSGSLKDLLHSIISPISLVNKGVEEVSKVKKLWNAINAQ